MKKTALSLILLSSLVSAHAIAADDAANNAAVSAKVEEIKNEFKLNDQQAKRISMILTRAGMSKEDKRAARVEKHIQRRVERMTKKLDLNDEQTEKLKAIFTQQHEQMQAMREQGKADITSILTPEQATKFAEMRTKRKGWHGKHRKRGGHGRGHKCNMQ